MGNRDFIKQSIQQATMFRWILAKQERADVFASACVAGTGSWALAWGILIAGSGGARVIGDFSLGVARPHARPLRRHRDMTAWRVFFGIEVSFISTVRAT